MMNWREKELQKILSREKVEYIEISENGITITTEDKEILIQSNSLVHIEIKEREHVE